MKDTHDKVLFGAWLVMTALFLVDFIEGAIVQNYDIWKIRNI